jgi:hypothetical protein
MGVFIEALGHFLTALAVSSVALFLYELWRLPPDA